jgi:hypothetical protein
VTVDQTLIFTRLDASNGVRGTNGGRVFSNHLARSKVSLQVTRGLSVRVIGDYGAVLATRDLTSIESRRRATADVLGTFQVNPFTALHIGYTSGFENAGDDAEATGLWRIIDLPPVNRQAFAKISYGIRF